MKKDSLLLPIGKMTVQQLETLNQELASIRQVDLETKHQRTFFFTEVILARIFRQYKSPRTNN